MNFLTIPYIAGGLSHLIPLYVLQQRYLRSYIGIKNHFLVNNKFQGFLNIQGLSCVSIDYSLQEDVLKSTNPLAINNYIVEMEMKAYDTVKPSIIIEDTSFFTPLIAEKNNLPRISIQRTGIFRAINSSFRNSKHVHSLEKGSSSINKSVRFLNLNTVETRSVNNTSDLLQHYIKSKVKIIPGIPTIECLPENIKNRESYFYSGPLIIMDKPSHNLTEKLRDFLYINKQKPIVFITTGTIDRTPIEDFIEFFVKRNYAVITTCDYNINESHKQEVFYKKILPLNYICGISNLVIHQCGSGMYHYPIINRVPSLTIGTQCYDREDISLRLEELGVSRHIPHPDDNSNYWNIFLELINKFENKKLVDFDMLDKLKFEIDETSTNFRMDNIIEYALS